MKVFEVTTVESINLTFYDNDIHNAIILYGGDIMNGIHVSVFFKNFVSSKLLLFVSFIPTGDNTFVVKF